MRPARPHRPTYEDGALASGVDGESLVMVEQREGATVRPRSHVGVRRARFVRGLARGRSGAPRQPRQVPVRQRRGQRRVQGHEVGTECSGVHGEHGVGEQEEGVARPRVVLPLLVVHESRSVLQLQGGAPLRHHV